MKDIAPSAALARMFNARTIAVIGASADPSKRGYQAIRKLQVDGYGGTILPVNPKAREILGLAVYPDVPALPQGVDLALICTPAPTLPSILRACGARGIPGAIVLAAGFGETGAEGAALAREVRAAARAADVRVIGPNTNGIFNLHNRMNLVGVEGAEPGSVGLISQSGNMMLSFITEAKRRGGVGFSSYVGVGNQLDLRLDEYLRHFGADPNTRVPLFYIEGFEDGRAFLDTCRDVSRAKPVVIYKSGRTDAGQVAASSHTGALASGFGMTRDLLRQAGATVIERSDIVLSIAEGLSKLPLPTGTRVAILADGGGHATVTVDALTEAGVELAHLAPATEARLRAMLPAAASVRNPVDVAGGADDAPSRMADYAKLLLDDPDVGILMIVGMFGGFAARFNPALLAEEIATSRRLADLARQSGKPLLVQSVYSALRTEPIEVLKATGVPTFVWAEPAVRCVAELLRYSRARDRLAATAPTLTPARSVATVAAIAAARAEGRRALYEHEAAAALAAFGVTMPPYALVRPGDDPAKAAASLGDSPVAMKIVSRDIPHKSDAGGVRLNLLPAELSSARDGIVKAARAHVPGADIHGVLLAPMAQKGVEVILGVLRDPMFGPVMMFGLGGVFVEVMKDVAFRALPLARADAEEMIDHIQARALLDGVRGADPVDRAALIGLMTALSDLTLAHPEIAEIDLNPVILRPDGYDVVDARMILAAEED